MLLFTQGLTVSSFQVTWRKCSLSANSKKRCASFTGIFWIINLTFYPRKFFSLLGRSNWNSALFISPSIYIAISLIYIKPINEIKQAISFMAISAFFGSLITILMGFFTYWWRGEDSNLRRQSRQIYSLIPLTAREPLQARSCAL